MAEKIDVYPDPYTKYVVTELVDIKGKSQSDVVQHVLKQWISDHHEELKDYGIDVERAKEKGWINGGEED